MNDAVSPSRHCFALLVDNEPGVLARVIGLFSGRGYNIESLTVDEVDAAQKLSRITIVTCGTPMIIDQIGAQLARLVPVRQVVNLTRQGTFIESGVALLKIAADAEQRMAATALAEKAGARIAHTNGGTTIYEITAQPEAIDRLIGQLRPYGLVEIARSGSIAIGCGEQALKG